MEIIKRFGDPTPDFFVKAQKWAIIIIAIAGALIAADKTEQIFMPGWLDQICNYIIVIGVAVLGTAQTARK